MAARNARQQLVELLDKKVFDPIRKASPDKYEDDRDCRKVKG